MSSIRQTLPFSGYNAAHPFSLITLTDRESVQELLKGLLDPLIPFFSPQSSRIKVPGGTAARFDVTASEIEGYARPLWGLASLLAGGGTYEHSERWVDGLRAGTNPESPEYWGQSVDSDQRMVEMCCIGYTLATVPSIWESLSEVEKSNVETYLSGINDKVMPNTNWLWFRVFANLGLRQVRSLKASPEQIVADITHLDSFYRSGGWSNDGPENVHQMDYYSGSFAIQVLQLLYARISAEVDPENSNKFKERATLFAADFIHYFDEEGRAIPFGRSVGYRFAMTAFWSAAAFADVELPEGFTWGIVKGLVLRNFRWWQKQAEIFGVAGTLTLGYTYPNMYLCENYNSPGSPYWACIAFICLAVPATHPFWTSQEEAYPTSSLAPVRAVPPPKHIISYLGGHRMLLSSGQACGYPMKATHAKYGKFAYSSAYGFSVPPGGHTLEQYALDSTLGLSDDEGEVWKTRRICESASIEERGGNPVLISTWKPFKDVVIESFILPPNQNTPNWHIRAHKITSGRDLLTAEGSFAISGTRTSDGRVLGKYDASLSEGTFPRIFGNYDLDAGGTRSSRNEGAYAVSAGAVGIVDLLPTDKGYAMIVNADPNSNLVASKTVIPTLMDELTERKTTWYVIGIYAKPSGREVDARTYLEGWAARPLIPRWLDDMAK